MPRRPNETVLSLVHSETVWNCLSVVVDAHRVDGKVFEIIGPETANAAQLYEKFYSKRLTIVEWSCRWLEVIIIVLLDELYINQSISHFLLVVCSNNVFVLHCSWYITTIIVTLRSPWVLIRQLKLPAIWAFCFIYKDNCSEYMLYFLRYGSLRLSAARSLVKLIRIRRVFRFLD